MNILEIRELSKSFGFIKALKNISLEIRKGEIHTICGENGAGKSTLVKILDGFYPYGDYEGEFFLEGRKCEFHSPKDSSAFGIAMIYQEISILDHMSVADNIFAGKFPKKGIFVDNKRLHDEADEILDMINLNHSPKTIAGTLNTSEKQLLMIAHALTEKPKVLILDEPTSALTPKEVETLFNIIRRLKETGVSCIYISHKLDELAKIADRLTIIRDGETIETLSKEEINIDRVITGMVGRKIGNVFPKRNVTIGERIFSVKNLTVKHPKTKGRFLVNGLSFELRRGEVLGIVGLVGAGRSETLNAIYGYIKKESGEIEYDGVPICIRSPKDAIKAGIALVTDDRKDTGLFEDCEIKENISSNGLEKVIRGIIIDSKLERKIAKESIERFHIKTTSEDVPVNTLSGGNQQKVVLAKALLTEPAIILLDEPTRGIDVGSKYEIYQLINQLVEKSFSIILVSSELPELMNMSDRILVLAEGIKKAEFLKGEVSEETIMKYAVLSDVQDGAAGNV